MKKVKKNSNSNVKKPVRRVDVSSKELKVNLEQLQKDVSKAYDSMKKMMPRAIKNLKIKKFGNAAHVILPKEFSGKRATVFIMEK
ncbi:MAG: DUF2080 family transposase-associated protein [Candidatus Pacearchaeota archaeon]